MKPLHTYSIWLCIRMSVTAIRSLRGQWPTIRGNTLFRCSRCTWILKRALKKEQLLLFINGFCLRRRPVLTGSRIFVDRKNIVGAKSMSPLLLFKTVEQQQLLFMRRHEWSFIHLEAAASSFFKKFTGLLFFSSSASAPLNRSFSPLQLLEHVQS